MQVVRKISAAHTNKIVAVLRDLLGRAEADEIVSLAFLAEEAERTEPLLGVVGRYREQPTRLIGELSVMKAKLTKFAHKRSKQATFQESVF